jgi:hypothetical protein
MSLASRANRRACTTLNTNARSAAYQGNQQHQADIPGSLLPAPSASVVHHLAAPHRHCPAALRPPATAGARGSARCTGSPARRRRWQSTGLFYGAGPGDGFLPRSGDQPVVFRGSCTRQLAPASDRAVRQGSTAADSHWSTTPAGHCARPARSGNRQCPDPAPK